MLSNAARKAPLAQEEATRAHTEALATAEATQAKVATSHAAAERRTRVAAEERSRVMREWKEWDRARAAEVAAAARSRRRQMLPSCKLKGFSSSPAASTARAVMFPPLQLRQRPTLRAFLPLLPQGPRTRPRGLTRPLLPRNPISGPWALTCRTTNAAPHSPYGLGARLFFRRLNS